jgi:hypothetical protein
MRAILSWFTVVVFSAGLWAQADAATPRKSAKKKATSTASRAATQQEINALREQMARQAEQTQQQIRQLTEEVQRESAARQRAEQELQQALAAASQAQSQASAANTMAGEQKETVTRLQSDMADVKTSLTNTAVQTQDEQKKMAGLEGMIGRFRFTGDIRVRYENFFQGLPGGATECSGTPVTGCVFDTLRNRERIRLRFGVMGKLNDDFTGGIFIAAGSLSDPTSTNETLTNVFERKVVGFDRGYITYNPKAHKWLTLTGGKFATPWMHTNPTFDPDINPEGFNEQVSYNFKSPVLKNVTFQALQLLFNESAGRAASAAPATIAGGADSFAVGGSVSAKLEIGKFWTVTPVFTILNWRNADVLLNESFSSEKGSGTALPNAGAAGTGVFAPNGLTNATFTGADGARHFFSRFLPADFLLYNTFKTPYKRLPVNLIVEYLNNLNAEIANPLAVTVANPLGLANPSRSCGASCTAESHLYYVEISVGQQKNKGDFLIGYDWHRHEQDATIASFNDSDQRAPSNIVQNRFYAFYKIAHNTQLGYTFWLGRTLDTSLTNAVRSGQLSTSTGGAFSVPAGTVEPWLKRMQFDVIYTF